MDAVSNARSASASASSPSPFVASAERPFWSLFNTSTESSSGRSPSAGVVASSASASASMKTSRGSSCSAIAARRASGDGEHAASSSPPPWEMDNGARRVTPAEVLVLSELRELREFASGARIGVDGVLGDVRVGEIAPDIDRADGEDTPDAVSSAPTASDAPPRAGIPLRYSPFSPRPVSSQPRRCCRKCWSWSWSSTRLSRRRERSNA